MGEGRGVFIAFEGIDGSGKSTQAERLKKRLDREKISCRLTREPTDSLIGSLIRQAMTGRIVLDNAVIAALFVADRLDHLLNPVDGLRDRIGEGVSVLTDRYCFSSYAYQSVDMGLDWVIAANAKCAEILRPDLTVFLDVSPDAALARIAASRPHVELFENRERLLAVRERYFAAFDRLKDVERVAIVNGEQDGDAVEAEIWEQARPLFQRARGGATAYG